MEPVYKRNFTMVVYLLFTSLPVYYTPLAGQAEFQLYVPDWSQKTHVRKSSNAGAWQTYPSALTRLSLKFCHMMKGFENYALANLKTFQLP